MYIYIYIFVADNLYGLFISLTYLRSQISVGGEMGV